MKSRLLPLIFLLLSFLPAWSETRLAILADEGAQPTADLLTAQLSGNKELTLVERTELDKVLRESNLSTRGNLQCALSVAELVHANGIVVLETHKIQDKVVLSVRLVASAPGVIIAAGIFGGTPSVSADAIASRFQPLWAKLSVPKGDAIALSLLNLRCALKGSEALETQLTFLLAHQLMQQPELFVLERSRMDDLLFEKAKEEAFWNGSHIVDGRIESAPEGKIKVTVFLRPSGNQPPQTMEALGDREHLAKIADELASHIVANVIKQPATPEWKEVDESAEYLKEAKWAFDAQLYSVARSSVESAWALGNREPELYRLRILIYSALAFPSSPKVRWPDPTGYSRDTIDVTQSDAPLRAAFQALGYFHDYRELHFPKTKNPDDGEDTLGSTALLAASRVLRNYYERGLMTEESLPDLRRKARETANVLFECTTNRNQKPYYFDVGGQGGYPKQPNYEIEAVYLPYWNDTPGQAIEAWRTALKRSYHLESVRQRLVYRFLPGTGGPDERGAPWLVAWKHENAEELDQLWNGFIDKLSTSGDPREALDAALLRVYSATEHQEQEAAMIRYCEQLWEKREPVMKNEWGRNYITLLRRFYPYRWAEQQQYRQRWLGYYLQNATSFDDVFLRFAFERRKDGSDLLDVSLFHQWQSYKDRLSAAGNLSEKIRSRCKTYEGDFFQQYLQPEHKAVAIPSVHVTQHWVPERSEGNLGKKIIWQENQLWVAFIKRNDEIKSDKECYRLSVCALEVPSFTVTQTIETPANLAITETRSNPEFFLTPTSLFLRDGSQFHRYDRKQGTWTTFLLPEYRYACFLARGDELFAGFSDKESGIVKWSAATREVEVIASNRRRPALSPFDDCPEYAVEGLFGGENGKFGVIVGHMEKGSGFYWCNPETREWKAPFPPTIAVKKSLVGTNTLLVSRQSGVAIIDNETGVMSQLPGSNFGKSEKSASPVRLPEAFNTLPYKELGISIMPATAYADGCLWTLRTQSEGTGRSLLLNRAERLDQLPSSVPDVRLVFQSQNSRPGAPSPIKPMVMQMPTEAAFTIAAAPSKGLVFRIFGTNGLWFMPFDDFSAALAAPTNPSNSK